MVPHRVVLALQEPSGKKTCGLKTTGEGGDELRERGKQDGTWRAHVEAGDGQHSLRGKLQPHQPARSRVHVHQLAQRQGQQAASLEEGCKQDCAEEQQHHGEAVQAALGGQAGGLQEVERGSDVGHQNLGAEEALKPLPDNSFYLIGDGARARAGAA